MQEARAETPHGCVPGVSPGGCPPPDAYWHWYWSELNLTACKSVYYCMNPREGECSCRLRKLNWLNLATGEHLLSTD
jgi:hypothetical protein